MVGARRVAKNAHAPAKNAVQRTSQSTWHADVLTCTAAAIHHEMLLRHVLFASLELVNLEYLE